MSLSSEYGRSCFVEISFKDGSSVELRIDIPLDLILEIHGQDKYGDPIYIEMTHEKQIEEQIPYIQHYLENWCNENLKMEHVGNINADYDNYEFYISRNDYIIQSEPKYKIEAKCNR